MSKTIFEVESFFQNDLFLLIRLILVLIHSRQPLFCSKGIVFHFLLLFFGKDWSSILFHIIFSILKLSILMNIAMASSQVEFATSSPFGCTVVHNRRASCFQMNFNDLVTSCIPNDTSHHHMDYTDLWVHHPQRQAIAATDTNHNNKCNTIIHNGDDNDDNKYIGDSIARHHQDKWARAREIVFSVDHARTMSSSHKGGSGSPTQSESSVEVSNLGSVSSLVQKWRGFEAVAKRCSKSNSGTTLPIPDNVGAHVTNEDDTFGDWESDKTALSGSPSSRGRDSDATEKERLRVSDIIKKLTEERLNDNTNCDYSTPRVKTSTESETRCFSPSVSSPRIRGRQAFNDLLMQMERERHNELEGLVARRAVSKFSQRGRIQALLRVRFLRRGMKVEEAPRLNGTSSELHKSMQSGVVHSREINNSSVPNGSIHSTSITQHFGEYNYATSNGNKNQHQEVSQSKSFHRLNEDHIQDAEVSLKSNEHDGDHISHKVDENEHHNHGKSTLLSTFTPHEINCESNNNTNLVEFTKPAKSFHNIEINHSISPKSIQSIEGEEEPTNQHLVEVSPNWVSDVFYQEDGWEELHSDYQQEVVNHRDWICEVSRPRSNWEGLRQARYQEMLDPFLDNEDIRLLLGRKSVSNFLSSGMREQIERVMISRTQGEQTIMNNHIQEEEHCLVQRDEVRVEDDHKQLVISEEDKQEEKMGNYGDYYDEYEEVESPIEQHYNESDDCMDLTTSSPSPSWTQNQGHEVANYSHQIASPSTQQSLSSNSYSQENQPSSSFSVHPAIDMELIYDLRQHMELLHQEISELRRSVKCCVNMQIKLQRSIKTKAAKTLNHSDEEKGRSLVNKTKIEGQCCVCCKMQVDSLLYRCGHMCTCLKCAHELQWSSGKCPICRAPITDVVRTYYNS
ncbi:hypothetical protein ACJIZ3_016517 [Penstemon smallii]|uniref:RING-type domain-containing protein n=1 Tax=Penstemon smallii TaxID=265156 RepID=A0ABD3STH2_9LAMI